MKRLSVASLAVLLAGIMLFGVAMVPVGDAPAPSTECPVQYEVTVATPSDDPHPTPFQYSVLPLDQQRAFQLALASNGTARLSTPTFEQNTSYVLYRGTEYGVTEQRIQPTECPEIPPADPFDWQEGVFVGALLAMGLGVVGFVRSLFT
jgi:hypothetical protein